MFMSLIVFLTLCFATGHINSDHGSNPPTSDIEIVLNILNEPLRNRNYSVFPPIDPAPQMWSDMLENITLSRPQSGREAKANFSPMYPNPNHPYRKAGEAPLRRNDNNFVPLRQAPINFGNRLISPGDVSETDLYLLSAIEKLVYRVDYLEKRVQKTDTLVLHLLKQMNADKQQQSHPQPQIPPTIQSSTIKPTTVSPPAPTPPLSNCPKDFTRIATSCYHIEIKTPADWQTASMRCKANGARLAEFERAKDFNTVQAHLLNTLGNEKVQLWLGGLNPGLLWIWSSSAQPVTMFNDTSVAPTDKNTNIQTNKGADIAGKGRCLNLRSNDTHQLQYYGEDCSKSHSYMCEFHDRTVENTISRVLRALNLE